MRFRQSGIQSGIQSDIQSTEQQAVLYVAGFRSESAVSLVSPPDSGE